jgi:protoporphyrinogen/coproporphyrinogen III oxidase
VVVGAGLAGLVAAYALRQRGVDVTVLEGAPRPGGRMTSEHVDGFVVDCGAQFLSTGYPRLLPLVGQLGLAGDLVRTGKGVGIVRGGTIRRVSATNPLRLVSAGVLSAGEALHAAAGLVRVARRVLRRPRYDLTRWTDFDSQAGDAWARRQFGVGLADRVLDAMVSGFYFQDLRGSSAVLPAVLAGFAASRSATLALRGGLGRVTAALAAQVPVRCDTPVLDVHAEDAAGPVRVHTADGEVAAEVVIVATPVPATRVLLPVASDAVRALLDTPYSRTLLVGLRYAPGWTAAGLRGIYGVLVPPAERRTIAAVGVESHKAPGLVPQGELLNVMLGGPAVTRLLDADDDQVTRAVVAELSDLVPEAGRGLVGVTVCRWRAALPWVPPGQAARVARYRRAVQAEPARVILAGDYLGLPFTDSVTHTGQWAAAQALRRLTI